MDSLLAITIILLIFAIGDFISAKTKSIVSMMFVASVIFMVGFWFGLPTTIFEDAHVVGIGALMIGFLITHMGTLMSFSDLKEQWKTVVIALGAVSGIGILLLLVGSPILGREYAVAAAPPISGGVVAALIMADVAKAKGLESIAVFATIIVVIQGFFGYPVASFLLNKEAKNLLTTFRKNENKASTNNIEAKEAIAKKRLIPELPKNLQTSFILLAKLAVTVVFSFQLAELTNGLIHKFVMCLIIGILAREIGFLEENIMVKANAFGLGMVGLMSVVFRTLTQATPEMLLSLLFPLVISLLLGLIGIILMASILGKLLGYSPEMAISIGVSALFGFPGTFILSNEVANANGKTEEERQFILNEILPKMLVAGFLTVTVASVLLAGIMNKML